MKWSCHWRTALVNYALHASTVDQKDQDVYDASIQESGIGVRRVGVRCGGGLSMFGRSHDQLKILSIVWISLSISNLQPSGSWLCNFSGRKGQCLFCSALQSEALQTIVAAYHIVPSHVNIPKNRYCSKGLIRNNSGICCWLFERCSVVS